MPFLKLFLLFFCLAQAHALTLEQAAKEAVEKSPEIRQAFVEIRRASLEEPELLALTDPVLTLTGSETDDQGPREIPAFQGPFNKSEDFEASIRKDLLIGTETRLFFKTQKLNSPALFRPINPTQTTSLGVEIRQPLLRYFWGRPDKAKRRQARAGVAAAKAALKRASERRAAAAMFAYVEAYIAQRQIAIREAALQNAKKLLQNYGEKRRYGLIDSSDFLQAEVSVRTQEIELRLAQSQLKQALENLRRELHREPGNPIPALQLPPAPAKSVPGAEQALNEASRSRGDFLSALHMVERAESFLRAEKLNTLPDLAAFGSYAWGGLDSRFSPSWREVKERDFPFYTTGLQLQIPFFFKSENVRRTRAALNLEHARAQRDALEAEIRREVNVALDNLELARSRAEAYADLLSLERGKLSAAEKDFERGRASTDLLIRFQSDIHRTETLLIQAQAEALAGWARLGLATGTLMESLNEISGGPQ